MILLCSCCLCCPPSLFDVFEEAVQAARGGHTLRRDASRRLHDGLLSLACACCVKAALWQNGAW